MKVRYTYARWQCDKPRTKPQQITADKWLVIAAVTAPDNRIRIHFHTFNVVLLRNNTGRAALPFLSGGP